MINLSPCRLCSQDDQPGQAGKNDDEHQFVHCSTRQDPWRLLHEALKRSLPGAGEFPLADFVAALANSIGINVEVASAQRIAADLPTYEHARKAVNCRVLLEFL